MPGRGAVKKRLAVLTGMAVLQAAPVAHAAGFMDSVRSRKFGFSERAAPEKLYDVDWWQRAVEQFAQPFRPIEPATPEVDPAGNVYVATSDGKVHALGRRGISLWDYDAGGPFDAGPLFADDKLFIATSEGRLQALNPYTGERLWEYQTGEDLLTQPVLSDGLVFAMSANDTLFAVDAATGKWKWQYRREFGGDFSVRGAARPLVLEGKVYAGFADGYAVALDSKDGGVLWARQLGTGSQFLDVDADPVADEFGNRVYFASYASGIFCIDAQTGNVNWSHPVQGIDALLLDPSTGRLFAGGNGRVMALDAEHGIPGWNLDIDGHYASGLTLVNRLLLVPTGTGPMLFVDASDGTVHGTFDSGHGIAARPTVTATHDTVVLSNGGVVYDLDVLAKGKK